MNSGNVKEGYGLPCPKCNHPINKVTDSRQKTIHIRRIRRCDNCGYSFKTTETVEIQTSNVVVDSIHVGL